MKAEINLKSEYWRFWFVTQVFILAAVFGWVIAYYLVMIISLFHVLFFLVKERSVMAFPTQIRLIYFLITLFGLWKDVRLVVFFLLLLGTSMVTFLGRCSIALLLKRMPWNKEREIRMN